MLPYYVRLYPESGYRVGVTQFSFYDMLSGQVAKTLSRRAPARLHGQHTLSSASIRVYGMPQGEGAGRGGFGHACFARLGDGPAGVTKLGEMLEIERWPL